MILITGGTGFVGRHAVRRFVEDFGTTSVRLLVLPSERDQVKNFPGVQTVVGDLSDEKALQEAVSGVDAVVHLASKNIDTDGTGFKDINVEGTRRLCAAAVSAGVGRLIYASSVGVYGHRRHRNADETTPVRPDTAFSRSKAEAESIVLSHHRKGGFQGIILRHRFVYGEGDVHVIPRMMKAAASYPFLINGGRAEISLILTDDLASVLSLFVREKLPNDNHPVYHATDGVPVSYKTLIHHLCDTFGFKPPRASIPYPLLFVPVRVMELLTGSDPETVKSSLSSMRLKLVGLDQSFSNHKLRTLFPQLKLKSFTEAFPDLADYYAHFT